jgi:hypothetical protein
MSTIERKNPGRAGFSPGIVRVVVKTTLHPITHRALCVAAVEQDRPLPLILDDALADYFDIPIEARLPDRPPGGPGAGPEVGSDPRGSDRRTEGTGCGPSAS